MTRVIVASEKHGDRILDASTDEKWLENSMALLRERLEEGHWYWDPDEWDKDHPFVQELRRKEARLMEVSDEDVDNFPDSVARAMKAEREQIRRTESDAVKARKFLTVVRETLDGTREPWKKLRNGESWPRAWWLLHHRRDAEYEYVELKETE